MLDENKSNGPLLLETISGLLKNTKYKVLKGDCYVLCIKDPKTYEYFSIFACRNITTDSRERIIRMLDTDKSSDTLLLETISELLENTKYKVLEGDRDTIYVKDTETDEHFSIRVQGCSD